MLQVNSIYAYIESLSEEKKIRLLKYGWNKCESYYFKEVSGLKISLFSFGFADQVCCTAKRQEEVIRHVNAPMFDFIEGWSAMWKQNIVPMEVTFITLEDLEDKLLRNGWKSNSFLPEILELPIEGGFTGGLTHFTSEDTQSSQPYYSFQDITPGKTFEYVERLRLAKVI